MQWTEVLSTIVFWIEESLYRNSSWTNPFEKLSKLSLTIIIMSHKNADMGRIFSHINNLIKSAEQNLLSLNAISKILIIKCECKQNRKFCFSYTLPIVKRIALNYPWKIILKPHYKKKLTS